MNRVRRLKWAAATIGLAAGVLLAAGYVILFWSLDALPFQDLPNHLTRAAIEADILFHGGRRFGALFTLKPIFTPYAGGDALLVGFVEVFGAHVGGRLWVIAIAASLPIALAVYLRVTGHSGFSILVASMLSLYLTTDWFFLSGFHHYRLGVAWVVLALAAWQTWLGNGQAGAYVAWTVLLAVSYLTHLSAFVFAIAGAGAIALVALATHRADWRRAFTGLVPALALLTWQIASGGGSPGGARVWGGVKKVFKIFSPFYRYGWLADAPMFVMLVLACVLLAGGKLARRDDRFVTSALLAVLFVGMYAVIPFSIGPLFYLDARAVPLAGIFAVVAALDVAESHERRSGAAAALSVALAAGNLAVLSTHLVHHNSVMQDYRAVAAQVPAGVRVLPVVTRPEDGHTNPYVHAGAFATLEAGAVTPYLFSGGPTSYFQYRRRPTRALDEFWYQEGGSPDEETRDIIANQFEYLLVMNPFDPRRLPVRTDVVLRNEVAALVKVLR